MYLWRRLVPHLQSAHTVLMILLTLGYLLTTHLSTMSSLKAAIADKADRQEVEQLNRKLARIEVMLEEAVWTKAEFNRLQEHFDRAIREMTVSLCENQGKENNNDRQAEQP